MLGSLIPSSRFLIRRLLKHIDWDAAHVVIEYGPGVGTFTRKILERMRPDAKLLVLETNPDFVAYLRDAITDPRLEVIHESAADVRRVLVEHGLRRADYIIAGIPLSTLSDAERREILRATYEALRPEGVLLVYQFSPKVLPHLQQTFSRVRRGFEPLNVLPAHLFYCVP